MRGNEADGYARDVVDQMTSKLLGQKVNKRQEVNAVTRIFAEAFLFSIFTGERGLLIASYK